MVSAKGDAGQRAGPAEGEREGWPRVKRLQLGDEC